MLLKKILSSRVIQELFEGFSVQLDVVKALILRETRTRFGTAQLGYLWSFIEMGLWIGTFWAMYHFAGRSTPNNMDIVGFISTGIVTFQLFRSTASRCESAINGNKALLYYPQVKFIDLFISRGFLEFATLVSVFFIINGLSFFFVDFKGVSNFLVLISGMVLSALLGMASGMVVSAASIFSETIKRLSGPLMRPLFWVSGIFFTAHMLPSKIREYLLYNPILHCIEMVRSGWYPVYNYQYYDIGYVLFFIAILFALGLTLSRAARRRYEV